MHSINYIQESRKVKYANFMYSAPPNVEWDCFYFITGIQHRFLGITHPTAIAQTHTTNMPHVLLLKQSHKAGEKHSKAKTMLY